VIPPGDPLELVSCSDTAEPEPRCHAHRFGFGDRPKELIEGGHSGAPILWRGKLVATFIGGNAGWFAVFQRFWWLRTLTVDGITLVRPAIEDVRARASP
jgi:hypothetical protein